MSGTGLPRFDGGVVPMIARVMAIETARVMPIKATRMPMEAPRRMPVTDLPIVALVDL